jgi:hypothetical protein
MKQVSQRTRHEAQRAVRMGVIGVDLVSLRRDRMRAHANLGERVLTLWSAGGPGALGADQEALRLRALVESVEASIQAKERELAELRADPGHGSNPPESSTARPESPAPQETSAP